MDVLSLAKSAELAGDCATTPAGTRPYATSTRRSSDESLWRQMEVEQETAGMDLEMETAEGEETMTRVVRYSAQSLESA